MTTPDSKSPVRKFDNMNDDPREKFVVRARGLPWCATAESMAKFFSNCNIRGGAKNGIHFTYSSEGHPSGECFVELVSREDKEKALAKSNNFLGESLVEVFESKAGEMEQACKRMSQPQDRGNEAVVQLRGLHFQVSKEEIEQFFTEFKIVPNGITITLDEDGRTTGDAFVEFASPELASQAMKKNKEFIVHRGIEIYRSSKADRKYVLKEKQPSMCTQPVPYGRPPDGIRQRRFSRRVRVASRRSRFESGDQYQVHTRKDLPCERSISAQIVTLSAMLKNKQSMEGFEQSYPTILRISGSGEVPAKLTGDVVDTKTIYKMSRAPRGIAIIINNKNFLSSTGMDPRNGTDVDRDALEKLFKSLKFGVKIFNDVTTGEIKQIAQFMAAFDHSDYDAFIFSILTHGKEGLLYGTDGTISIRDLTSGFKDATTLAGKPKLFFFQACQGNRYMDGVDVPDGFKSEASSKVSVPEEADFLYAYSTVPGYYSWRNTAKGSWFIQSLTKVFGEEAEHMDILRMLTRVNGDMSNYKSCTDQKGSHDKRQVASFVSRLLKDLYFFPEKVTEQN